MKKTDWGMTGSTYGYLKIEGCSDGSDMYRPINLLTDAEESDQQLPQRVYNEVNSDADRSNNVTEEKPTSEDKKSSAEAKESQHSHLQPQMWKTLPSI